VILAAGFGSRMTEAGKPEIKPLLQVGGIPVLHRALAQLELAGCDRVVVVVGHRAAEIESALDRFAPGFRLPIERVHNPDFRLKNGVSLLAAAHRLPATFVLAMADHVVGEEVMALAREHEPEPGGATLLVDRRIGSVFDLDDATKVATEGGRVVAIGKELPVYDAIDTGVFVATHGLLEALAEVRAERGDASLSEGVERLARRGAMSVLDIGEGFWQDVDTVEMLAHAERELARRAADGKR
jgi:choline kinase